jgi:hypothetical protein
MSSYSLRTPTERHKTEKQIAINQAKLAANAKAKNIALKREKKRLQDIDMNNLMSRIGSTTMGTYKPNNNIEMQGGRRNRKRKTSKRKTLRKRKTMRRK